MGSQRTCDTALHLTSQRESYSIGTSLKDTKAVVARGCLASGPIPASYLSWGMLIGVYECSAAAAAGMGAGRMRRYGHTVSHTDVTHPLKDFSLVGPRSASTEQRDTWHWQA